MGSKLSRDRPQTLNAPRRGWHPVNLQATSLVKFDDSGTPQGAVRKSWECYETGLSLELVSDKDYRTLGCWINADIADVAIVNGAGESIEIHSHGGGIRCHHVNAFGEQMPDDLIVTPSHDDGRLDERGTALV